MLIVVILDEGTDDNGPGTVVDRITSIGDWDARNPRRDPRARFWVAGGFRPGDRVQLLGGRVVFEDQAQDRAAWLAFARSKATRHA